MNFRNLEFGSRVPFFSSVWRDDLPLAAHLPFQLGLQESRLEGK